MQGLKDLLDAGASLLALKDLHSKLYIFDSHSAIVGSANFTYGGFNLNHELGLLIENEDEIITKCHDYFNELYGLICNDRNAIITAKWIEDEMGIVRYRMLTRKNVKEDWTKRGAELPRKKISDLIEQVISTEHEEVDYNTGIWLKFEGTGDDRVNNELNYFQMKGSRNRDIKLTYFPKNKRPMGIKSGDILFIGVVSYDKDDNPTPMIVGYAVAEAFNKINVVSQSEILRYPWKERFPFFIEYKEGHFINAPIKDGIRLVNMYSDLGSRTFPSTKSAVNVTAESLRQMHFRRSHLHITGEARDYLMKELNKLFNQYGKLDI